MTRQPCFAGVVHRAPFGLEGTDEIMRNTVWVGTFPGLGKEQVAYMAQCMKDFFESAPVRM